MLFDLGIRLARPEGFEPPTLGLEVRRSIQAELRALTLFFQFRPFFSPLPDQALFATPVILMPLL